MGTESIIARKTREGFIGTSHYWDGYPSGVGQLVAQGFKNGGWNYLNAVLAHNWSSLFHNECYCCETKTDLGEDPGKINHSYAKEEFVPYTHETECEAEFAYVFEHESEKETDFMHIYLKASVEGEWKIAETIDLGVRFPDFRELQRSLWETLKEIEERKDS